MRKLKKGKKRKKTKSSCSLRIKNLAVTRTRMVQCLRFESWQDYGVHHMRRLRKTISWKDRRRRRWTENNWFRSQIIYKFRRNEKRCFCFGIFKPKAKTIGWKHVLRHGNVLFKWRPHTNWIDKTSSRLCAWWES